MQSKEQGRDMRPGLPQSLLDQRHVQQPLILKRAHSPRSTSSELGPGPHPSAKLASPRPIPHFNTVVSSEFKDHCRLWIEAGYAVQSAA